MKNPDPNKGIKKKIVNQEVYDRLVDAFRQTEGQVAPAARMAKVARKTADRAYKVGYPSRELPPIKKTLELEKLRLRKDRNHQEQVAMEAAAANEAVDAQATRAAARRDAISARIEEGKMIKAARQTTIQLMESAKSIAASMNDIAPRLANAIRLLDFDVMNLKDLTIVSRLMRELSMTTRAGAATAMQILQAERLLLGQPMEIVGTIDMNNMTEKEAIAELDEAVAARERFAARQARRGKFSVIDGGSKDTGT